MKKKRNPLIYRPICSLRELKRFLLHRRGDGVHSPYAFHLITKVLRNPYPYDCFRYLAPQSRKLSQNLRKSCGDRAIYSIRTAEVVFRLAVHHHSNSATLIGQELSLLEPYLLATSTVKSLKRCILSEDFSLEKLQSSLSSPLIIIEDLEEAKLKDYLSALKEQVRLSEEQGEDLMLILNSNNPILRKYLDDFVKTLLPVARFSMKNLEVFVWRKAMTKGNYQVYVKH